MYAIAKLYAFEKGENTLNYAITKLYAFKLERKKYKLRNSDVDCKGEEEVEEDVSSQLGRVQHQGVVDQHQGRPTEHDSHRFEKGFSEKMKLLKI